MSLKEYRRKRDFAKTPEPAGEQRPSSGSQFIVQKHAARRLHYDFRLELDGVLKSWAVPKGPSLDPDEKRLAVHVEDHPIEYGSFEGVIPEGEYGGGTVMLWDRGTWEPHDDPQIAYKKGKLSFTLQGEKLRGGFSLVRMSGSQSGNGKNWLLIKKNDEHAQPEEDYSITEALPLSIDSGRTIEQIARDRKRIWSSKHGEIDPADEAGQQPATGQRSSAGDSIAAIREHISALDGVKKARQPATLEPQLAVLGKTTPTGDDWLHEIKLDGYRLLIIIHENDVKLYTRRRKNWTERFPAIHNAATQLPIDSCIIDGEVVALDPDGTSNFQLLQNSMRRPGSVPVTYFAFDLPFCSGFDLRSVSLEHRKDVLSRLLDSVPQMNDRLQFSDHIIGRGREAYQQACNMAVEGLISKRLGSRYRSTRSNDWVKSKCTASQEFVICGYTKPGGSRTGFGALLLGVYDDEQRLLYCGKVGTGFTEESLHEIYQQLQQREVEESAFDSDIPATVARSAHWVQPELVAEVEFIAWTSDNRLRHPSFKGVREEKDPSEIRRETSGDVQTTSNVDDPVTSGQPGQSATQRKRTVKSIAGVKLTNPDRILYPEMNITKLQLAEYYQHVGETMLPHVVDRPLALLRCPQGQHKDCFFQKHFNESVSEPIVPIPVEESDGKLRQYLGINDIAGLVMLAQLGVLEIHPWGSQSHDLDHADRMIIDLDPDPAVSWSALCDAAELVRELLRHLGLQSFVRLTGGKGLHVVTPLKPAIEWPVVKAVARAIALEMVRRHPDRYVAVMGKARRSGRIYLDYLRNNRGATAIASYSTRARPGATVAVPLDWDELRSHDSAAAYNINTTLERVAGQDRDPWQGLFELDQTIDPEAIGTGPA